jgi:hypothetical protein
MWYLTRGSGIVAAVLVAAALVWGFFFSARETGRRHRPAWWLDLHNWLGGLALIFTGVHVAASYLDRNSGIGITQIFVPGTAALDPWGVAWGVIATYLLFVVVFTTWPRRLGHRRWWRVLHLTSVAATGLALLHSYQSGTEATRLVFRIGLLGLVAVSTYALGIRLFGLRRPRRRQPTGVGPDSQAAHSLHSSSVKPAVAEYDHDH